MKYLVREPIFTNLVKPGIEKVFSMLWLPAGFSGYFVSYINYYRYYSFIA